MGLWIGGAEWGSEPRVSRIGAEGFGEPEASYGLRSLPEPDFGPDAVEAMPDESFEDAPREMTKKEKMLADFPLKFEAIPPQILEDIDRIAEADTPNAVPPEIMEELEEQLSMAGIANPNRSLVEMAAQTMENAQMAYQAYVEADKEIPFPSEDELQRMREIRDRSVPTPDQWELLGGRPESSSGPSNASDAQPPVR